MSEVKSYKLEDLTQEIAEYYFLRHDLSHKSGVENLLKRHYRSLKVKGIGSEGIRGESSAAQYLPRLKELEDHSLHQCLTKLEQPNEQISFFVMHPFHVLYPPKEVSRESSPYVFCAAAKLNPRDYEEQIFARELQARVNTVDVKDDRLIATVPLDYFAPDYGKHAMDPLKKVGIAQKVFRDYQSDREYQIKELAARKLFRASKRLEEK